MTGQNIQSSLNFVTPELTHRVELILHLLEYSNHLVIVKGEHESGKSTLCEELIRQEETNLIIRKLYVNTHTNINDIFKAIIDGDSNEKLQEATYNQYDLNEWLVRCQNKQQIPVLLIDNIDLFNDELINNLFETLTNSNKAAVLHVCLFCETLFLDRLEESGINQDESRSLHIIEMPSLSEKQTEQYIRNKYPTNDTSNLNLFDDKTIKQIHRISHGMPGRVNALCEQYLDDPAISPSAPDKKPFNYINTFILKNKLILLIVVFLLFLSVGVATLLHQTANKEVEKQTIKLALPNQNKTELDKEITVQLDVPQDAEPITVEDLSPSVIPEVASIVNEETNVTVYNADGQVVAKGSDLQTSAVVESVEASVIPIIDNVTHVEDNVETAFEPEAVEEVKLPNPMPIEAIKPLAEPVKKDIDWLVEQDPKKYVLQLIGAYENETIDLYLKSFKNGEDNIISFSASNKGKEWHVLLYGLYDNREQAIAAIKTLPTRAKLMVPWPRTVQSIKDQLK